MTPPNKLQETIKQVTKILGSPGCRYGMFAPRLTSELTCTASVEKPRSSSNPWSALWRLRRCLPKNGIHTYCMAEILDAKRDWICRLCPVFQLSNVTGQGLDFVSTVLFRPLRPASQLAGRTRVLNFVAYVAVRSL